MATKISITLCAFFFLLFVGCTIPASVQRRILREISAETTAPQTKPDTRSDTNAIADTKGKSDAITSTSTIPGISLKPYCTTSEPCGWAVYEKFTRHFDYYMANVCRCPSHKHCHRTGDDLTQSAYVYTCIQEEINETIPWVHPPPPPTTTHQ